MRKCIERSMPEHALTIRTYAEFQIEVNHLATGKYTFLLVIGNSGLQKTRTIKSTMNGDCAFITGSPTPFGFYEWIYNNVGKSILVLDDVSPAFYKNATVNSLMKNLTDTYGARTLQWQTKGAEQAGLPNQFTTDSRVAILVNEWDSASEHIRAIEGRATTIVFKPSFMEVHRRVADWLDPKHQDVYNFLFENRGVCMKPNMRLYHKGVEQKEAGNNWKQRLYEMMAGDQRMQAFINLMKANAGVSNNKIADLFSRKGMGGSTLFYALLKAFRAIDFEDDAQPITLGRN